MLELGADNEVTNALHQHFLDSAFPPALSRDAFAAFSSEPYTREELLIGLASWRARSLDEYRSQVAFTELLGLLTEANLPFDIVGTCIRVVRDEARHVELCRRMVNVLGADDSMPGEPNWIRTDASLPIIVRIIAIGVGFLCVGETLSRDLLAACSQRAANSLAKAALTCIASDEAVHSKFGWTLVERLIPLLSPGELFSATLVARRAFDECSRLVGDVPKDAVLEHPFGYLPYEENQTVLNKSRTRVEAQLLQLGLLPKPLTDVSKPVMAGKFPPALEPCRVCDHHIIAESETCPHCGNDVIAAKRRHTAQMQALHDAHAALQQVLAR